MKHRTRSILQELNDYAEVCNRETLIESRAINVIRSAINLLENINNYYDADVAADLEKKLLNSIKSQDPGKFSRAVRQIAEGKQ